VKTNSTGDVEWAHNFGGPNDDYLWTYATIVETDDGGLMFAGETKSFGAGNGDIWLIKTDMLGNALWNKTYGGANEDGGGALIKTTGGGYLIAGYTGSLGAGGVDAWLVKIDADGNEQWNRTYGGTSIDVATCVVQTTDGGYAVGAVTESFGLGGIDAWLVKTDDNGIKQWDRVYGGAGCDEFYSIIQVSDDIFVLGGDTNSIGAGGLDGWLLQTDLEYGLIWKDTTPNSLTLFRPVNENQTNFVRVRLLKIEP
jgi:predicted secreted protein